MSEGGVTSRDAEAPTDRGSAEIARELTGDLPCARCGYNLRGLSILDVCAECGLPIKATILALVDPQADELKAIDHPRLVQAGLLAWMAGAFVACLAVWAVRGSALASDMLGIPPLQWHLPAVAIGAMIVSMLGALTLVRPHRDVRLPDRLRAMAGVACYFPIIVVSWLILYRVDPGHPSVYGNPTLVPLERAVFRIILDVSIIGAALWLRPNALHLAHRSVLVRSGRVDRQPMTALAAASGVAMGGDVLHLVMPYAGSALSDLIYLIAAALIAVGSFLLTVGVFSLLMDVWRLRQLIAAPGIGLTDIFDETER
ncbi:MAG: hypothetical protein D6695_00430 [Planctomycetota bacterium]|nr:MAG: hypothetical protein D6695_00430 [Planctomycetota bacterium]